MCLVLLQPVDLPPELREALLTAELVLSVPLGGAGLTLGLAPPTAPPPSISPLLTASRLSSLKLYKLLKGPDTLRVSLQGGTTLFFIMAGVLWCDVDGVTCCRRLMMGMFALILLCGPATSNSILEVQVTPSLIRQLG